MVWGCMSIHGIGEIVVIDGKVHHVQCIDVLEHNLLLSVQNMFGEREHPVHISRR